MEETFKRYELLSKEVKYIIPFVSNWEVFDFKNLEKILNEMKELQEKMKQNELANRNG